MPIKFDVRNRWTGAVQFTAEIECDEGERPSVKMGSAAKWAFKSGADLRGAVLSDADLSGAVLRDAVLRGADLRDADLSGAVGLPWGGMPDGWKLSDAGLWVKA